MAPPIPGLRKPVQVPTRTAGDVLIGILAIMALAVLTIGVPIGLITVIGLPVPHGTAGLSVLTHQLDIPSILRVLSIVIWLAWLQLVWCVIVEIKAAVRNVGLPAQVPLAGATQSAAHRLVTAALLLFTAGAALSPAFAHSGPPRPSHTVSSVMPGTRGTQGPQSTAPQPVAPPTVAQSPSAEKVYVVKPPDGRYHESLWEIAENHLGDGRRYPEIYAMNKDRMQPDGSQLTIASLIRPGWILRMPQDAYGPGIETVTPDSAAPAPAAGNTAAGHGTPPRGNTAAGTPAAGNTAAVPGGAAPGASGSGSSGTGAAAASPVRSGDNALAAPGQQAPDPLPYPYELSAASLLAAGVLAALGRRRREQLWRRAFGQRIAVPDGPAAMAENALRFGADEPSVRLLDVGLRQLSQALASQDKALPTVFAAHIGAENLDLWVAPADPSPPAPWTAADGGAVWRLPLDATGGPGLDGASGALAPYPGLVSIGTNETGRILVDLEVAHGLIAVRGPHRPVQAALAALAVELATNRWSDQMRITLVGFGEELTMIAPERVTAVATLDEALPALQARAAEVEQALAESGRDSVLTGRSRTTDAQTWAPHYLIMAVPPTPTQRERLLTLARTRHRSALGFVVAGDIRGATWTWEVTGQGRLRADVLGFDLAAQLLPASQYGAVADLFRTATRAGGVDLNGPDDDGAPSAQLVPGSRMPVEIGLLGPLTIEAPGPVDAPRQALSTELVAYLATHPGGVHPNVLTGAIWPRGVPSEVRDAALARVQAWLGTDDVGRPNLTTDAGGRLRLGSQVRVDWLVFRALLAQAGHAAESGRTDEEAAALDRALGLVRGQLLDGRDPGRYAWLAADSFELRGDRADRRRRAPAVGAAADGRRRGGRHGGQRRRLYRPCRDQRQRIPRTRARQEARQRRDHLGPGHRRRFRAHHSRRRFQPAHRSGRFNRLLEPHRQRRAPLPSGNVDLPSAHHRGRRRAVASCNEVDAAFHGLERVPTDWDRHRADRRSPSGSLPARCLTY